MLPDERIGIFRQQFGRNFEGGRFDKIAGLIVISEKEFDFLPESLISVAALLEKNCALLRRTIEGRVKKIDATLPALRLHPCFLR
jgi:hypothetical protein